MGKRFLFKVNVDSRNVRGVSSMFLVTRMTDNAGLLSHCCLGSYASQSYERDFDSNSASDSCKVYTLYCIFLHFV